MEPTANIPIVRMEGITKHFPGVVANDHVDFSLERAEIHALLGENGAGKTTLMNILYGLYSSDGGSILVRGAPAKISSPRDSIALGIAMVHQQFELIEALTVSENVALGHKSRRPPMLDLDRVSSAVSDLSSKYGLKVSADSVVRELSMGERQRVEIIKALYRNAEILILDEPTSVLTPEEVGDMFRLLKSMTAEGKSVVVITHKLPEVMAISDRVTVMRKGRVVGEFATRETTPDELARCMVGREISSALPSKEVVPGSSLLELRDVRTFDERGTPGLRGLSISVRGGEIVGVAGVAGNGQSELVDLLLGLKRASSGSVQLDGNDCTKASPHSLIGAGLGVIPEDRKGEGLVMEFSIAENLILEERDAEPHSKRYLLQRDEIRAHAEALVREYSISTPDVSLPAYTLSGGNLQRLLLAKVLSRGPKVLVASQPTAGLDVGATQFIWDKLRDQRAKGVGILLISSDLNEIMTLSDRIACIYGGSIVGTLSSADADVNKIGLMMGGARAD